MKRIVLFIATNLAVMALLTLIVFVMQALTGVRLDGPGFGALLAVAAISGSGGALISLALSKCTAKRLMGVRIIEAPQSDLERWLLATVQRLAAQVHIDTPEVGTFDSEDMNAFATGARRNAALVAVSTGLLQNMSRPQVEAVLGHEISHVANGDMVTLALLQGVLNTFVMLLARIIGNILDRALWKNDREAAGLGFFVTTLVAQWVLGVFASMIVSWYSRRRELRADRGGAALTDTPHMIAALRTLQDGPRSAMPSPLQAFGIKSGRTPAWSRLFMSHPPLDERIAALENGT